MSRQAIHNFDPSTPPGTAKLPCAMYLNSLQWGSLQCRCVEGGSLGSTTLFERCRKVAARILHTLYGGKGVDSSLAFLLSLSSSLSSSFSSPPDKTLRAVLDLQKKRKEEEEEEEEEEAVHNPSKTSPNLQERRTSLKTDSRFQRDLDPDNYGFSDQSDYYGQAYADILDYQHYCKAYYLDGNDCNSNKWGDLVVALITSKSSPLQPPLHFCATHG